VREPDKVKTGQIELPRNALVKLWARLNNTVDDFCSRLHNLSCAYDAPAFRQIIGKKRTQFFFRNLLRPNPNRVLFLCRTVFCRKTFVLSAHLINQSLTRLKNRSA
jgi:hypothetical protein